MEMEVKFMKDEVFGELSYGEYDSWEGRHTLDFGGNVCSIGLSIRVFEEEKEITQRQKMHLSVLWINGRTYKKN